MLGEHWHVIAKWEGFRSGKNSKWTASCINSQDVASTNRLLTRFETLTGGDYPLVLTWASSSLIETRDSILQSEKVYLAHQVTLQGRNFNSVWKSSEILLFMVTEGNAQTGKS